LHLARWDQPFAQFTQGRSQRNQSATRVCYGRPNE
jgi:hypothetical protein